MNTKRMSDEAIANQLGEALRQRRLRRNITQEELAGEAGVSTPTLHKLEQGKGSIALLIAVLRALNALDLLTTLINPPRISPLEAAKTGKLQRARATGAKKAWISESSKVMTRQPNIGGGTLLIERKKNTDV